VGFAWVIVDVLSPIVIAPVLCVPVLAAIVKMTLPSPEPLPEVIVIHGTLLEAFQEQLLEEGVTFIAPVLLEALNAG
jgi:hypothetical protein